MGRFYTLGRTNEKWQLTFRKRLQIQEGVVQDFTLDRPLVFGAKSDLFWKPKEAGSEIVRIDSRDMQPDPKELVRNAIPHIVVS